MTEYVAKIIDGNFFDIAKTMNEKLSPAGWELVAVQTVNQFHSVVLLKREVK